MAALGFSALVVFFALLLLSSLRAKDAQPSPSIASPLNPKRSSGNDSISSTALLDATFNSMREAVIVVDESLRVVASNPALREVFADVDGRFESKRLSDLTRNSSVHAVFRAAIDSGERAEMKIEPRGNRKGTFDLRVEPLRFGDKALNRGAIGVFFDITKLERLEGIRQEFLSNVSHELRTPLTAILAFVETLEDGAIEDSDNNRKFLQVIARNATRMHNLIDDILELSAIEAGTIQLEPRPVKLFQAIEDIKTALATRANARRVKVRNSVDETVMVCADPRRLEQMLTNLIDNAIKFSREGGSVVVEHERNARDRISVKDDGEGISAEHIERIFERFYRVDKARSREMGGTGLGLAIVKHLARVHGGEASVTSTVGEGTTFTIELPIASTSSQEFGQMSDVPKSRTLQTP
jgi:two-component system phosphate regulon sensor histidine kinase PhoR